MSDRHSDVARSYEEEVAETSSAAASGAARRDDRRAQRGRRTVARGGGRPRRVVRRPARLREEFDIDQPGDRQRERVVREIPAVAPAGEEIRDQQVPPAIPGVPPVPVQPGQGPNIQLEMIQQMMGGVIQMMREEMRELREQFRAPAPAPAPIPVPAPAPAPAPAPVPVVQAPILGPEQVPVVNPHLMELHQLQLTGPLRYGGEADPTQAESWLTDMVQRLDTLQIVDDRRASLASYYLINEAKDWWISLGNRRRSLSWAEFSEIFHEKFIPKSVREAKAQEFLHLTQRTGMSVSEYVRQFERLWHYGRIFAPDDRTKAEKFCNGLLPALVTHLTALNIQTYQGMVEATLRVEQGLRVADRRRAQVRVEEGQSSQKKQRIDSAGQSSQGQTVSLNFEDEIS